MMPGIVEGIAGVTGNFDCSSPGSSGMISFAVPDLAQQRWGTGAALFIAYQYPTMAMFVPFDRGAMNQDCLAVRVIRQVSGSRVLHFAGA